MIAVILDERSFYTRFEFGAEKSPDLYPTDDLFLTDDPFLTDDGWW